MIAWATPNARAKVIHEAAKIHSHVSVVASCCHSCRVIGFGVGDSVLLLSRGYATSR